MDRQFLAMQSDACRAMSHPKRLEIIGLLREGERPVGWLVEQMGIPKANVSQHLAILRQLGTVACRREGQTLHYRIQNPKIIQACDLMKEALLERLAEMQQVAAASGAAGRGRERGGQEPIPRPRHPQAGKPAPRVPG